MKSKLLNPVDSLRQRAGENSDDLAFTFLDQGEIETDKLTYLELDQRARKIAATLQQKYQPGTRALLLFPTGADFMSAMYGCLFAGVIPIPTNPPRLNRPALRLEAIVKDSRAAVALTNQDFMQDLDKRTEQIPSLGKMDWLDFADTQEADAESWTRPEIKDDGVAFIQYTSGSTTSPRGVVISHRNVAYNTLVIRELRGIEPRDNSVIVNWAPIYHDMGLITGIFQSIYDKSLSVMMTPVAFLQQPIRWLRAISKYGGTASGGPNFSFDICVNKIEEQECEGLDLSTWKNAWNSAEPIRAETQERFADRFSPYGFDISCFTPGYGLAEATLLVSGYNGRPSPTTAWVDRSALEEGQILAAGAEADDRQELVSCGPPLMDLQVAIVDPQTMQACPPDQVGEIWVRGENVSSGYWDRKEDTERVFNARIFGENGEAYMRTGDLGFMMDGDLYVTGRLKDLIIVRGRNYYPQDIEVTVEKSHPAIQPGGGAAFAIKVDGSEHLIVVHEVKREARNNLDLEDVTKAVRYAIARDQGIRAYAVVLIRPYSLPKTSSGKVMRHAAKLQYETGELSVVGEWRATQLTRESSS
ncbi:MAG: fatty acyl-AMP ligase [Anaerolineae bacterium]|nr:fatty acyl-AMP ligase [Anaerolineae bacterium]